MTIIDIDDQWHEIETVHGQFLDFNIYTDETGTHIAVHPVRILENGERTTDSTVLLATATLRAA